MKVSPYVMPGLTIDGRAFAAEEIFNRVCDHFKIAPQSMKAPCRKADWVKPRQVFSYIAARRSNATLTIIGRILGGRNHATVVHSIRTVADRLQTDEDFRDEVADLFDYYEIQMPKKML